MTGEGEVPWPVLCKMISCSALESVHILSHCHDRQAAESLSQSLASAQLQSVGKISEISEISEIRDQRSEIRDQISLSSPPPVLPVKRILCEVVEPDSLSLTI